MVENLFSSPVSATWNSCSKFPSSLSIPNHLLKKLHHKMERFDFLSDFLQLVNHSLQHSSILIRCLNHFAKVQHVLKNNMILYILFLVWVLFFNLIYVAGSFVNSKRSHWMCSIKKAVLKNFTIFTGKHLCQENRPLGLQLHQKETSTEVFSCEYVDIFNTCFEEHLQRTASVTRFMAIFPFNSMCPICCTRVETGAVTQRCSYEKVL